MGVEVPSLTAGSSNRSTKFVDVSPDLRHGKTAKPVAGEHNDADRPSFALQPQRLAHIGRGEQIGVLAFLEAGAQQPGRAEPGDDLDARRFAVLVADLAQNLAQAAGSEHVQLLGARRRDRSQEAEHRNKQGA